MKKMLCALLAAVVLFSLAACGKNDDAEIGAVNTQDLEDRNAPDADTGGGGSRDTGDSAPSDPNLGLWVATTGEMWGISVDVADVFDGGFTIELKAGGKCIILASGEKGDGSWTLRGSAFSAKTCALELQGTLENDTLTLEDVMGFGVTLIFYKEGNIPAKPDSGESEGTAGAPTKEALPEALAWWDGEWYGYWKVSSADDPYSDYDGGVWDCYAIIDVAADSTATVYFWDDEIELATVEMVIYADAGGIMGGATSESGVLFGYPSEHADWVISPNFNTYDNMIVIQEWFKDPDGDGFRYEVFLRPWGMLWDDVPAGERPPDYDSWYVGQSAYAKSMYDALYEPDGVFVHPRLLNGAGGGNSGGSALPGGSGGEGAAGSGDTGPAPAPAPTPAPAGGAVVLSLSNAELKATWNEFQSTFDQWSDITYDKVVELLGAEGQVAREGDNFIEYKWYASDEGSLAVQFNKTTGGFNRSGMNQYGRPD